MSLKRKLFLATLLMFGVVGCAQRGALGRNPQGDGPLKNTAWARVRNNAGPYRFQEGCKPRSVMPPADVPVRGKVILIHGFTACPQQFIEWSERLRAEGWISYFLLMPGHGRFPSSRSKEDFNSVPGHKQIEEYSQLARDAVALAKGDSLPTVIVGLSVGGAVALDAVLQAPERFDRAMLVSPFFAVSNSFLRRFGVPVLGRIPIVQDKVIGWGAPCVDEMRRGRAGICSFRLQQLLAAQLYGKSVSAKARLVDTHIQILGVHDDGAASNRAIQATAKNLGLETQADVSACFYRQGANHSLFSRFDSPDEDKFWLDSLLDSSTDFVDHGAWFGRESLSPGQIFPTCKL